MSYTPITTSLRPQARPETVTESPRPQSRSQGLASREVAKEPEEEKSFWDYFDFFGGSTSDDDTASPSDRASKLYERDNMQEALEARPGYRSSPVEMLKDAYVGSVGESFSPAYLGDVPEAFKQVKALTPPPVTTTEIDQKVFTGIMAPPVQDTVSEVDTDMKTAPDDTQLLLDRIALGEGASPERLKAQAKHGIGTTEYDMVYNYGNTLAPSKPVTEMTLRELEAYQRKLISATKGKVKGTTYGTSAVGKYQVIKTSLFGRGGTAENPGKNSWADKLGLTAETVYTPEVQESIGMLALKEAGYSSYIYGKRSQDSFQNKIANIWASVAKADGSDTYGQGIHTFKRDLQPMFDALAPTRIEDTAVKTSLRPRARAK